MLDVLCAAAGLTIEIIDGFFNLASCRYQNLHRPYRIPLPTWACALALAPACLLLLGLVVTPWLMVRCRRHECWDAFLVLRA